ncbi:inhibitory synaptic factor 1 [Rhinatrema bivittatum]|uniref:inhibitory synaptic factor 1 n=1 Tax=Rhinatrema bivittatum TaxID=194408 RepID=UPI001126B3B1|nr:inhibitory synaptic factor 1 [Rhinatrema bivittatum]
MTTRGSRDREPTDIPSSSSNERERIRNQMKMVIGQLEGILQELKNVAKELREVVGQIDKLTSDFDFELEPDDWTTATVSSTSSSEKGGGFFDLGHLDFMTSDILSDSWEFCSFLEASTPSDSVDGSEQQGRQPDYRLMNGGLIPNGPGVETPDSSSEETLSSAPNHKPHQRTSGTRERVRFSDKVLYHALCCDDDEDEDQGHEGNSGAGEEIQQVAHEKLGIAALKLPMAPSKLRPLPASKPALTAGGANYVNPVQQRKLMRNSSTQTVSDKSTQTVLPYISAKQKVKDKN